MKTNILCPILLSAACVAEAASLGPAALVSGAARLDNGSIITLGQPFAGVTTGGGVTLNIGLAPAMSVATNVPASTELGLMTMLAGGTFRFACPTEAGRTYVIEASTNLAPFSWVEVQTRPGTGGLLSFADVHAANHPHRFYRVQVR